MKNDKKIRKKNVIAIDIGTSSMKLAIGKYVNNKLVIKKVLTANTPQSSISNGRITNMNALKEALKEVIKTEKIKEKYVIINMKSSSIINREVIIPYNDNADSVDKIVKFEMKQLASIDMDEYITQYQILEEYYDESVKMYRVLVTSVEKPVVEKYIELIHAVGLKPYVLDVHFNSISKFFKIYDESMSEEKTVAIIDIGYDSTDITLLENSKYKMSRTVDSGSNILESLFKNEFGIEFNEAQVEALFTKGKDEYVSLIKNKLDFMINEINEIIRFHFSRDSKNKLDNIFLTGGLSGFEHIVEYIETQTGYELYEFKILDKILVSYKGDYDIPKYINVIGSLVRR